MTESFTVIGAGAWGTAVALHVAQLGHRVHLYCSRESTARALSVNRVRDLLLPGVRIPGSIPITSNVADATTGADHWIIAVPTAFLRKTVERFADTRPAQGIISLTKGLEIGTFRRPSEIIGEFIPDMAVAILSGPSHAEEVARGLPTSLVVASEDLAYAQRVQRALGSERFRIYTSSDAAGVELAGAMKNVYGIAAGVGDGLGFGDNAKAALLSRSIVEMTRFGVAFGAEPATFNGLAGMGDLVATCFSRHGRNRRFGERIARGESIAKLLEEPQIVEGYFTSRSVQDKCLAMGLEMPIVRSVYELLYEGKPAVEAVRGLMSRQQRMEGL